MDCHLHLEHVAPVVPKTAAARMTAAASECRACHETGHSPQLSLYTGTGGRGVPEMPSQMFEAGVRCEGCHRDLPGHATNVKRASDVSCMSCHGASYERIYRSWKDGSERRTAAMARQLDQTAMAIGRAGSVQLADARHNLALVNQGHGVHNIPYAYALLRKSHDFMNDARRERGLAPLPSPWQDPPYESPCLACHEGIQEQSGEIFGRPYSHGKHVVGEKLRCERCHRTHEEKPVGEVLRFAAPGCESCHHRTADLAKPATCTPCHAGIDKRIVQSFRGKFDHAVHRDDAEKTCVDCHDLALPRPFVKQAVCVECHDDD
jgi:hypothetical protein